MTFSEWKKTFVDGGEKSGLQKRGKERILKTQGVYTVFDEALIGTKTATGQRVTGVSKHLVDRAQERDVSLAEILDALKNPIHVGEIKENKGGKSQEYASKKARVHINPDTGNIVTAWKMGSKRLKKILDRKEGDAQ